MEAFNKGINFYDTAPFYGAGSAERVRIAFTFPASQLQCLLRLCMMPFTLFLQHPFLSIWSANICSLSALGRG